ncbi:type I-E CRISPR-associated endoribonuclease Cas2e [Escherichia coli]|uniref:type I-E CRISPR-associated endoribonuclease Cas2e n=1 Tax=Escherichia coli TaxID=562 RepID=UPI003F4E871F
MSMVVVVQKMSLRAYVDGRDLAPGSACRCFVGDTSKRIREMIGRNLSTGRLRKCGNGWATNTESGFEFQTWGENRRIPVDWMGCVWFLFFLLIINKLSVL